MAGLGELIDGWIAEEVAESPVRATMLGIDGHDDRLGDYSEDGFLRRERRDREWLASFESLPDAGLAHDDGIDRDLAVSTLRGRAAMHEWATWRRDPATYLGPCLTGVFSLFLQRVLDEPELARCATARLEEVAGVLDAGRANLDPALAHPLIVNRALGQCRAGARYARDLVPAEVPDGPLRSQLAEAGGRAAEAFERFESFLVGLAEQATGDWAIGEARYSALLRDREQLGFDTAGLRERGQAAYDEIAAEMDEIAGRIQPGAGWSEVMHSLHGDHPSTPEEMRDAYDACTKRARQFLIDHQLVTLPDGEECLVAPSPPFQRPVIAVASYSSPPAFRPSLTGHFFVPFPPDGVGPDEIQQRLSSNCFAEIPTVTAHEAYPGHHWHLTWVQGNPRPLRKVIGTAYFTEGWALYAERVMREAGFFEDPRHDLAHLDARLFRAARIVVDTSLHSGEMTFDEAVAFMEQRACLPGATAVAEVGRYCTWPTQAASYLTGCLEIERIRERYLADGRGDVRSFNDAIAGSGMLPLGLAERAVLGG